MAYKRASETGSSEQVLVSGPLEVMVSSGIGQRKRGNVSPKKRYIANRTVLRRRQCEVLSRANKGRWATGVERRHGMGDSLRAVQDKLMAINAISRRPSSMQSLGLTSRSSCTASSICLYEPPCPSTVFFTSSSNSSTIYSG